MKLKSAIVTMLLLTIIIGGCASGPKKEEVDRFALIEQQLARILAELSTLQGNTRTNATAVAELREEVTEALNEIRTDGARSSVKLDTLENKISALTERIEDSELRITNMRKEITSLRISRTGTMFARPAGVDDDPTSDPDDPTQTPAGDQPLVSSSSEVEAYQISYSDYLRGEFNLAASGFRNYLRDFPNGSKVEDAQFFLAESLYNIGDYEAAVEEYDAFALRFPESPNVINATYKKGLAFLDSNQTAQGVILLQQLIRKYPDSNEARLAREKLRNLGLNP